VHSSDVSDPRRFSGNVNHLPDERRDKFQSQHQTLQTVQANSKAGLLLLLLPPRPPIHRRLLAPTTTGTRLSLGKRFEWTAQLLHLVYERDFGLEQGLYPTEDRMRRAVLDDREQTRVEDGL
jgi:hypothetical protein